MSIERNLYASLKTHLNKKEITLLIGPRQAGKTTLLKSLVEELKATGKETLFLNLDIDADAQYFTSQSRLLSRIQAITNPGNEEAFVFIDEVQRIENAGLFLKGLYDRDLPFKLIATGSGSLELKEKIAESLVGRKKNFYLLTVSIEEFLQYRLNQLIERIVKTLRTDALKEDQLLLEYLTFGGYPRVVTAPTISEKQEILAEIFQGYIERDIQQLLNLEKDRSFITLLQLMANRIGQIINYSDLSRMVGISIPTLKNYLWYAEKTFILEAVTPFFRNKKKEVVKAPQYYFIDNGLRNFLLNIQDLMVHVDQVGFLFQQLIYWILSKKTADSVTSIHYWRTQNRAEVDFVMLSGLQVLPVEVKSFGMKEAKIGRSLHSFIDDYSPKEAWFINRNLEKKIKVKDTTVWFRPWFDLLVD